MDFDLFLFERLVNPKRGTGYLNARYEGRRENSRHCLDARLLTPQLIVCLVAHSSRIKRRADGMPCSLFKPDALPGIEIEDDMPIVRIVTVLLLLSQKEVVAYAIPVLGKPTNEINHDDVGIHPFQGIVQVTGRRRSADAQFLQVRTNLGDQILAHVARKQGHAVTRFGGAIAFAKGDADAIEHSKRRLRSVRNFISSFLRRLPAAGVHATCESTNDFKLCPAG